MDLVPLKVKIGINDEGGAKYPDFNSIASTVRKGLDWAKYIDVYGTGWHYDCCGHKEVEVDSPYGQQWGMIMVPKNFADAAVSLFPDDVTKLTEVECEDFYDNNHATKLLDEEINQTVLDGIKVKQDLGLSLTAEQTKALDPKDDTPGITENKKKTWTKFKALKGVNIVQ